jgi:hypothetical protein
LDSTEPSEAVSNNVDIAWTPEVVFDTGTDEAPRILFLFGGEFAVGGFEFAEDYSSRRHRG